MAIVSDKQRRALLLWTGVKLSADGKSVFNYNPGIFQAGLNFLLAFPFMPLFLNRAHFIQLAVLFGLMHLYMWVLEDATYQEDGALATQIYWCYNNVAGLSRFVLGMFVSLVLSKTYYANRGCFGSVFGCSMGLAQMIVSWVRVPPASSDNAEAQACVKDAQHMLIRWINAAFRLMWLESIPGGVAEDMGKEMVAEDLLTPAEWEKIQNLSSRCTHIYQWMNNVLQSLLDYGYISSSPQLCRMNQQVDEMRGANVWGLPSLPITYTQIITHMVKAHVMMLALNNGALAARQMEIGDVDGFNFQRICVIVILHADLAFHHYLYQGLLDLHGALYNPCSGLFLGHLPAINFMSFVRNVTTHLLSENDSLPYKLNLVSLNRGMSLTLHDDEFNTDQKAAII